MKKLLLGLVAAVGITSAANAQLALETFNHGGTLPTGWTLINDGHTVSTSWVSGLPWLGDSLDNHAWWPISSMYTGMTSSSSDYQMITTSVFTPAGTANRWLITPSFSVSNPMMFIQWQDNDLGSGEPIHVKVSPSAGTTAASFTTEIYDAPCGSGSMVTHMASLQAFYGTNVTVAFVDDTTNNWGELLDNVQTVVVDSFNLDVTDILLYPFTQTGSSNTVAGTLTNNGGITATSCNVNYSINGGTPVTTTVTGISVPLGGTYSYSCTTPWVPSAAGLYTLKVWVDNINGSNPDASPAADTMTAMITVCDTLQPKRVMVEEFTQASCDPCAGAAPNVDSVLVNSASMSSAVRYHVNWPGRDCMDTVTLSAFVSTMVSYYHVSGVPDAQMDGMYIYPGSGGLSTPAIASAQSAGSPFNINVTASYNSTTRTYSYSADIVSHGVVPAGLRARACLAVDNLTYASNQSTETISQTNFNQVAENMFNGAAGYILPAFTAGSVHTISGTWVKNHPWGSDRSVWSYDSSLYGKIIVWVESDSVKFLDSRQYVYQAGQAVVNTTFTTGVNTVKSNIGSMDVYPNPANTSATVALSLTNAADVKLEVYNMAGQLVYSMPVENRLAGISNSSIDFTNLAAGEYVVKVTIGDETLNKKVTVIK